MAERNPAELFQAQWSIYQKVIDNNYMCHREIRQDVKAFVEGVFGGTPISVADLGCGDASQIAEALAGRRVSRFLGIDLSAAALAIAAVNLAGLACPVHLVEGDMLRGLDAASPAVDLIYSSFAIHHLYAPDKRRLFELARRRLRPGGVFVMVDLMLEEEEDRESFVHAYLNHVAAQRKALTDEEVRVVQTHVAENDFPEAPTTYAEMAKFAGFSRAEQIGRYRWHHVWAYSAANP